MERCGGLGVEGVRVFRGLGFKGMGFRCLWVFKVFEMIRFFRIFGFTISVV